MNLVEQELGRAKQDKENFVDQMTSEAEQPLLKEKWARYTRSPKVYVKRTIALFLTLKNKQGVVLTSEKDQAERWIEHFKQVINHPDPDETANIEPAETPLDIDLDPPNVSHLNS